ncbi:HesB/YadR/YfhF family protein [Metabacillus arenae]|uniref:HesB/YadR/YfhF family protein n=1 Tax=Metabacillus arenae TaxID=2771434 RepID=A0A926N9Q1_9BACI|nr:HesB/YadR/YfhF family protein [Metabacillus arenae]MBD1379349.1 HesB/YadR/YfhF family protein [Metabacillus arenae]
MKITISEKAFNWYKDELSLNSDDNVRFFVRYGGCSTVQKGFSLGVAKDEPEEIGSDVNLNGIKFFVEDSDIWYFDGQDLFVDFDEELMEPSFDFKEATQ